MSDYRGTITVATPGPLDAEVFLLARDGRVIATARPDRGGGFAIAAPAGFDGGWLLYKLYAPVVGARAVEVAAPGAPLDLAIAASEPVTLRGEVTAPAGTLAPWLDVHLTPRELDGLPAVAAPALLATGPEPVRRGTYVTRRITGDRFEVPVLPGVYRLEIERLYHDSDSVQRPPASVLLDAVDVDGGAAAERAPIGFWLALRAPTAVTARLRVVAPEDL